MGWDEHQGGISWGSSNVSRGSGLVGGWVVWGYVLEAGQGSWFKVGRNGEEEQSRRCGVNFVGYNEGVIVINLRVCLGIEGCWVDNVRRRRERAAVCSF